MDQPIAFVPTQVISEPPKKSRLPLIFLALLFLVLFSAVGYLYSQYYQLKQQLTQSQLLPSPSPETEIVDPTADWQTYTNTEIGFNFKYPEKISIIEKVQGKELIINFNGLENSFSLVVNPTSDHNFFEAKTISKTLSFNNISWQYLTGDNKLCDGGECNRTSDVFQTTNKNKRYNFILGNLPYPNLEFDLILSTFKFLGAEVGVCQPTFPVETNTQEMTASQNYALECNLKKTERDCLSVDIYNQSAKDFSQPDGESDCRWVISP